MTIDNVVNIVEVQVGAREGTEHDAKSPEQR
jgi:hypothetical protein